MTWARDLGVFAAGARLDELAPAVREALAVRILDAIGCALGGLDEPPLPALIAEACAAGGAGRASAPGAGRLPADRAALLTGAAIARLGYHDAFLAPAEILHPSETLGAVLAAAEDADASGADLVAGAAVAYAFACGLAVAAPLRARGFSSATHLAVAAAAGAARALGLDAAGAADVLSIAAATAPVLRVARDGAPSDLGFLHGPLAARAGLEAALLARAGIAGPEDAFEGRGGFAEVLAGPFRLAPGDGLALDAVLGTVVRRWAADVRALPAVEAAREIAELHDFSEAEVDRVEVHVPPRLVRSLGAPAGGVAARAGRSLPYLVSAALLDREVSPAQLEADRVHAPDVRALERKVRVIGEAAGGGATAVPARVRVVLRTGGAIEEVRAEAEGFPGRPIGFARAVEKLDHLAARRLAPAERRALAATVRALPGGTAAELGRLLAAIA